jgi:hypothetical protein
MTRITTAASRMNFGSITFKFIETSLHQECLQKQICSRNFRARRNIVNGQYQSLGYEKLIRIDRRVDQPCGHRIESVSHLVFWTPQTSPKPTSGQRH